MLLGRFELTEQWAQDLERSGLLEVNFHSPQGHFLSLDGNKSILGTAVSSAIAGLLVQDYSGEAERLIPFEIGEIVVVNDGASLAVYFKDRSCWVGPR